MNDHTKEMIRVVAEHLFDPRERLWGELVTPGTARILNISLYCDLSYGDVVKIEPLCSCDKEHRHYECGQRIFRATHLVHLFTRGTSEARRKRVAEYLSGWLVPAGYAAADFLPDGFPAGIVSTATAVPEHNDTHWRIAFPWPASKRKARAFLEQVPYVVYHTLERKEA